MKADTLLKLARLRTALAGSSSDNPIVAGELAEALDMPVSKVIRFVTVAKRYMPISVMTKITDGKLVKYYWIE